MKFSWEFSWKIIYSTTEEFCVEIENENNKKEERIIIISKDSLTEADVISGIDVLKLLLKYLIRVEELHSKGKLKLLPILYFTLI